MNKNKWWTYKLKHSCGHESTLEVQKKMSVAWIKQDEARPCPGCREVRR